MKIRNVSPRGALDVPLLRAVVDAREVVDVTPDQAARLLAQVDQWHPADKAAKQLLADADAADTVDDATEQGDTEGDVR